MAIMMRRKYPRRDWAVDELRSDRRDGDRFIPPRSRKTIISSAAIRAAGTVESDSSTL